ncbi:MULTISPECIES: protein kinase domain-containing protein [Protofrankia]|uniref:Serine/threonine protein kinase n=1 Tax=Candidatus Protofrankia datiscae TaxID=2716812 RepID=F8B4K4_9ACTN|nr:MULTISPECIES: protein kinase [Protofrankia]AEH07946.1 serine/threonine protein kinase [Candidatus Protofrankia datiscae]
MQPLRSDDPAQVGPYKLVGRLGAGGMGRVYLGRSPAGRAVAVKVVRPELADDPQFRDRFGHEVQAARAVSGAYTAAVIDADPTAERPWLATAYVPGLSLAETIRRTGPLPQESVRTLAAGLAEALAAVHRAGLVHRDLKPSNVLLATDGPRVIDFGISRAADATGLTLTGGVLGSPGFMAPEQITGGEIGPPCDVFALGALIAFAVTGREPFGTGPTPALVYRLVHSEPALDGIDGDLRELVTACLAKDPATRPALTDVLARLTGQDQETTLLRPGPGWLPPPVADMLRTHAAATGTGRPSNAGQSPAAVSVAAASAAVPVPGDDQKRGTAGGIAAATPATPAAPAPASAFGPVPGLAPAPAPVPATAGGDPAGPAASSPASVPAPATVGGSPASSAAPSTSTPSASVPASETDDGPHSRLGPGDVRSPVDAAGTVDAAGIQAEAVTIRAGSVAAHAEASTVRAEPVTVQDETVLTQDETVTAQPVAHGPVTAPPATSRTRIWSRRGAPLAVGAAVLAAVVVATVIGLAAAANGPAEQAAAAGDARLEATASPIAHPASTATSPPPDLSATTSTNTSTQAPAAATAPEALAGGGQPAVTGGGPAAARPVPAAAPRAGTNVPPPAPAAQPPAAQPPAAHTFSFAGSLTRYSCADEGRLVSARTTDGVLATFSNQSPETVQIYWLDFDGSRVAYAPALTAGNAYSSNTYVNHLWLVANSSGRCLAIFTAGTSGGRVTVY